MEDNSINGVDTVAHLANHMTVVEHPTNHMVTVCNSYDHIIIVDKEEFEDIKG